MHRSVVSLMVVVVCFCACQTVDAGKRRAGLTRCPRPICVPNCRRVLYPCPAVCAPICRDVPPAGQCPTTKIAEIPTGMTSSAVPTSVCLWELSDCSANPVSYAGTMYADCNGSVCVCSGGLCSSATPPVIEPGTPVVVDDEFVALLMDDKRDYLYASVVQPPLLNRPPKEVRSNKHVIPCAVPDKSIMIPPNEGDIMPNWGQNLWRVKYLKALQLRDNSDAQFFALYKVFNAVGGNPDGKTDLPGDIYIGIRTTDPGNPANVPGGMSIININSNQVKKLEKNNSGVIREVVVQLAIPQRGQSGNTGNPRKWFHLYGAEY